MLFCQLALIFNHKVHEVLRQAQDDNAKYTKFKRNQKFVFSRDGSGIVFFDDRNEQRENDLKNTRMFRSKKLKILFLQHGSTTCRAHQTATFRRLY